MNGIRLLAKPKQQHTYTLQLTFPYHNSREPTTSQHRLFWGEDLLGSIREIEDDVILSHHAGNEPAGIVRSSHDLILAGHQILPD